MATKSDKNKISQDAAGLQPLPVMIHTQYIKDLSFENPSPPLPQRGAASEQPTLSVDFWMDARAMGKEESGHDKRTYEVLLGVEATTHRGDKVMFMVELTYALVVSLTDEVPENQVHPLLMTEMPRYAFPFARQIVADVTQQGGYPPLYLAPVDFKKTYMQQFSAKQEHSPAA